MSLSLDFTGAAGPNLVSGETRTINQAAYGVTYITLANGPFFAKGLVVTYTDKLNSAARTLVMGVDFDPVINFPLIGATTNQLIYGALLFYDNALDGTLTVNYHALGGNWTIVAGQIYDYLNSNYFNPNGAFMALAAVPGILQADTVTPLLLNSVASITLAQTLYPSVTLGVEFLPLVAGGTKGAVNSRVASVINVAANGSGATPAGASYVRIKNNGTGAITAAGGSLAAGEEIALTAPPGESIYPIPYAVPAGGSALVVVLL
jgi:hypothetical protein